MPYPTPTAIILVAALALLGAAGCRAAAPSGPTAADLPPVTEHPAPAHEPVVLVEAGEARAVVVDHAGLRLQRGELLDCVEAATGVRLATAAEAPDAGNAIVIGDCPESRAAGLDPDALPPEGYLIRTAPGRVFLVGRGEAGTGFAVSSFLERVVGVRWYWPTRHGGRSVPARRALRAGPLHISDAPVYRLRLFFPPFDNIPPESRFNELTTFIGGGSSWPYRLQCHTPHWNANPEYRQKRPELFSLRANGERNVGILCYSHPRTLATYLDEIEAQLSGEVSGRKATRHMVAIKGRAITVSPADQGITCRCDYCRPLYEPEKGRYGSASKLMETFVAKLARAVEERWPEMRIVYLPYLNYTLASGEVEFPGNVEAMLCGMPGVAMYKEAAAWRPFQENIEAWQRLTGRKVQTWDYSCWPADRTRAPYQYPHVVAAYYRANREHVVGTFINGTNGDWNRQHLTLYVWFKAMWNPAVDVDAIVAGYCERMYGPAAGTMRRLVDLQMRPWEESEWSTPAISMKAVYEESFTAEVVDEMRRLLVRAREEVGGDELLTRRLDYFAYQWPAFFEEAEAVLEGTGQNVLVAQKVGDNPVIDGKLDDECWRRADPVGFERPGRGEPIPANYPTALRAVWTLDGISFAFRLEEPAPQELKYAAAVRDDALAWHNDNVEIFLDVTGRNEGRFYQWILGPGGEESIYDARHGDPTYTAEGMKVATHVGEDHWSLEVYIPYSDLPELVRPGTGVQWVAQFTRHRIGSARDRAKRTKTNRPEYSRLNMRFGGPSKNTGDFAPLTFVE